MVLLGTLICLRDGEIKMIMPLIIGKECHVLKTIQRDLGSMLRIDPKEPSGSQS